MCLSNAQSGLYVESFIIKRSDFKRSQLPVYTQIRRYCYGAQMFNYCMTVSNNLFMLDNVFSM